MSQSRREFLKSMVGASSILSFTPALPAFLHHAALAAEPDPSSGDRVLVVLQLSGGNDGLNTLVPYADDVYGRSRKTLRLTKREVLKIDDYLGFHPQLTGLQELMSDGHLGVLQGVGYPKNNRDHEAAMREWHTAKPGTPNCQTGWIGRTVDLETRPGSSDVPAAFVGPIAQPFALRAEASVVPNVRQPEQWAAVERASARLATEKHASARSPSNPLLTTVQRSATAAHNMGQRVEQVLSNAGSTADYPSFTLAGQLRTVSQLIQADLGVRIYLVEIGGGGIGGFDNHANQRDNHAALLYEMSESITAFVTDLQRRKRLEQVLLMTFSEFGRTVSENGRRGTGHGAAAPMLLLGGRVRAGLLGQHPSLTDLEQDAPKFNTDYRRVYATMLENWLGYDAEAILGGVYKPVDVLV